MIGHIIKETRTVFTAYFTPTSLHSQENLRTVFFDLCKVYESVCLAGEVPRGQRGRGNPLPSQFTRRARRQPCRRGASLVGAVKRTDQSSIDRPRDSIIGEPHAQRATPRHILQRISNIVMPVTFTAGARSLVAAAAAAFRCCAAT